MDRGEMIETGMGDMGQGGVLDHVEVSAAEGVASEVVFVAEEVMEAGGEILKFLCFSIIPNDTPLLLLSTGLDLVCPALLSTSRCFHQIVSFRCTDLRLLEGQSCSHFGQLREV